MAAETRVFGHMGVDSKYQPRTSRPAVEKSRNFADSLTYINFTITNSQGISNHALIKNLRLHEENHESVIWTTSLTGSTQLLSPAAPFEGHRPSPQCLKGSLGMFLHLPQQLFGKALAALGSAMTAEFEKEGPNPRNRIR